MTRAPLLLPVLTLLLAVALAGSLMLGPVPLSVAQIGKALAGGSDTITSTIVLDLRLPRAMLGALVGGMLALSGAVLQGYLRNPLAEPSVVGVSNAAALGAVVALYFGFAARFPLALPLLAIAGAVLALGLLFLLAAESTLTVILAGIAVSMLAGAGVSLALNLSPNPFAAMEIMSWLMGSLENRTMDHVALALPCVAVGAALLLGCGRALDALSLGEEGARSLGVDLARLRLRVLAGTAIGVGGAVAVAGAVGFVGLIVPHLLRRYTDRSPSALLLPSMLGGAVLLTLADAALRLIPTADELRLGVVTAVLGVPVFVYHLMRERRAW